MTRGRAALITVGAALAGVPITAAVCALLGKSVAESIELAGVAALAAGVVGACGALVLLGLRGASVGTQVAAVTLSAVLAVGVGALAAAYAMFISAADLSSLAVIVVAAGWVGVVCAVALGRQVARASRLLGVRARRIGEEGSPDVPPPERPPTRELAQLAEELDATAARLEESRRRERALDAARRELVAWVSHDLRTPLAGIRAITEALEDGIASDPQTVTRYLGTLRRESDRLAALVDDLFELSRIHAGAVELSLEAASLADLVSDAIAAADPVAAAKGVRLGGRLRDAPPALPLSTPEFARVLRNLLDNAIRETPPDGAVCVEAGIEDGRAFVAVADSCGGIPDDDLPRVFDTAFRGRRARTPAAEGGGGLGLAIAHGIVAAHHGDLTVTNTGPGCRFTVHLPLPS